MKTLKLREIIYCWTSEVLYLAWLLYNQPGTGVARASQLQRKAFCDPVYVTLPYLPT